ncbi:hypothetical protein [Sphingobacterium siyangense]|uniref:hypothetical protein n=1 Tax=Sphingobacterium siyangense TaxID=459529 RepID=UPI0028AD6102|nr:hypothetical protein [Sphingobacterium siyangense]
MKQLFLYIYKMNLKHLLLTTTFICLLFSCKKSDSELTIKNEEDLELVDSSTFETIAMRVSPEIKAEPYFMVGYGYDAKENLLFVDKGLRAKILDTDKLKQSSYIFRTTSSIGGGRIIEKNDKQQLLKRLSLNFDMEQLGTTETDALANIPSDQDIQLTNHYTEGFQYSTISFAAEEPKFQNQDFINFVQNNSPELIVKKYGTHVILSCSKGASVNLIKYLDKKTVLKDKIIKDWKIIAFVSGADLRLFGFNPTKNIINVSAWLDSLTEENGDFIDFNREQPMPIYKLIPDKDKKLELMNYIDTYLGIKKGS